MSASSLLEQVQARPACLGHCVRREGARLGPGPPPPVGPSRGGASRGPGFGPLRPAAPSASPSARSPRFSPGVGTHRPRRVPSSQRASFSSLFPSPSLKPWSPRVVSGASPAFSRRAPPACAFPRLPFSASPSPSFLTPPLRPAPLFPSLGPALICLSFSVSSSDDLLLGDVFFSRRDRKVKETKVSPAPPVALGREGDAE